MRSKAQPDPSARASRALSDNQLFAQLARHDLAALDSIYDRYAPLLYTILCDVTHSPDTALEDVFVLLWERMPQSSGGSLFARLLALTAEIVLKQGEVRQLAGRNLPLLPKLAPYTQLPNEVFDVLVLAYVGRLRVSEIATALGHTQNAIIHTLANHTPGAVIAMRQLERGASY